MLINIKGEKKYYFVILKTFIFFSILLATTFLPLPCQATASHYSPISSLNTINFFSISDFGATGNGSSDDSNSIQQAFNELTDNSILFFPPGTYLLTQSIDLRNVSNVQIVGINAQITSTKKSTLTFFNCPNLILSSMNFNSLARILFDSCQNSKITNCSFSHMINYGLFIQNKNKQETNTFTIDSCNFYNTGYSKDYLSWTDYGGAGNDIRISSCSFSSLTIKNCQMIGTTGHAPIFIHFKDGYHISNLNIINNTIHDVAYRGIQFLGPCNSSGKIENNIIFNCGTTNNTSSGVGCNGIYAPIAPNISVENNIIYNVYENGIEGNFKNISYNLIQNTGIDSSNHPTPSTEAIWGNTPHIDHNIILNSASFAIGYGTVHNNISQDIYIHDNIITNIIPSTNSAIHYWGGNKTSYNIYLSDNIIEGFSSETYSGLNSPLYVYQD